MKDGQGYQSFLSRLCSDQILEISEVVKQRPSDLFFLGQPTVQDISCRFRDGMGRSLQTSKQDRVYHSYFETEKGTSCSLRDRTRYTVHMLRQDKVPRPIFSVETARNVQQERTCFRILANPFPRGGLSHQRRVAPSPTTRKQETTHALTPTGLTQGYRWCIGHGSGSVSFTFLNMAFV